MNKWYSDLWDFLKRNWLGCFILILVTIVSWIFVDRIDIWVVEVLGRTGIRMEELYEVINNHIVLNIMLTIGAIVALSLISIRRYKDRHFSCMKFGIAVSTCILLYHQTTWVFVSTALPFFAYNELLACGLVIYVLMTFVGVGRGIVARINFEVNKRTRQSKTLSLYSDKEGMISISHIRSQYSKMLVSRMLMTDVAQEAFAIGILGEWGSGKTLFLDEMKKEISDNAIVVDFNPWNSKGAEHLVKDFMGVLAQRLSPLYSGISSPIYKYVSLLYTLRLNVMGNIALQLSPKRAEKDLAECKQDIEYALSRIGKPVVVIIDDVDRLEGKEIFEMLRIIRNTAMFRNMYYIVAYDKAYVVDQLSHVSIENGKDYLEKIFQIEVQMPKPDEKILIEEFKSICRKMSIAPPLHNSLFSKLTDKDYYQMVKVLVSFRKVKRFARQFAFNADFMWEHLTKGDFEIQDMLFLSLIECCDGGQYFEIWQNPETFFEIKYHPSTMSKYYSWPKTDKNGGEVMISPNCVYWVDRLFNRVPDPNSRSIQYVDSFYKYFYMSQPEKHLSNKEFSEMLGKNTSPYIHNGMKASINSWVISKETKSFDSIFNAFVGYKTNTLKDSHNIKAYLQAAFFWLGVETREMDQLKQFLPQILTPIRFRDNQSLVITQYAGYLVKQLAEEKNYLSIAGSLSELYRRLDAKEKLLIDIKDVQMALEQSLIIFFKSHDWDPILLFVDDGNLMRLVVGNCCTSLKSKNGYRVNLAIDTLIAYYSQDNHKSRSYVRAEEIRKKLSSNVLYSHQQSGLPDIASIFGDNVPDLAFKLLDECFIKDPRPRLNPIM